MADQAASSARPVAAPSAPQVFQEYAAYIWRTLRYCGVHSSDIQDVCQEAFLVIHRRLPEFENRSSLRTWIYGICLRVAAQYRRRAHRRHEDVMGEVPEVAVSPPQVEELEHKQARVHLQRVLDGLAAERRDVFVLYEIQQLPMTEIAEILGCPLRTAYSRLESARKDVLSAWERTPARSKQ